MSKELFIKACKKDDVEVVKSFIKDGIIFPETEEFLSFFGKICSLTDVETVEFMFNNGVDIKRLPNPINWCYDRWYGYGYFDPRKK
jgi:hypothetical protein